MSIIQNIDKYLEELNSIKNLEVIVKCLPMNYRIFNEERASFLYCYEFRPKLKRFWMYINWDLRDTMYDEIYDKVLRRYNEDLMSKVSYKYRFLSEPIMIKLSQEEVEKVKEIVKEYVLKMKEFAK